MYVTFSGTARRYDRAWQGMESYCVRAFAEAMEVVPYTLAENAGLNPIQIVTELRNRHAAGEKYAGINVRKGAITNMLEENIVQPLLVTSSALTLACECVRMILKVCISVVDPTTAACQNACCLPFRWFQHSHGC